MLAYRQHGASHLGNLLLKVKPGIAKSQNVARPLLALPFDRRSHAYLPFSAVNRCNHVPVIPELDNASHLDLGLFLHRSQGQSRECGVDDGLKFPARHDLVDDDSQQSCDLFLMVGRRVGVQGGLPICEGLGCTRHLHMLVQDK